MRARAMGVPPTTLSGPVSPRGPAGERGGRAAGRGRGDGPPSSPSRRRPPTILARGPLGPITLGGHFESQWTRPGWLQFVCCFILKTQDNRECLGNSNRGSILPKKKDVGKHHSYFCI